MTTFLPTREELIAKPPPLTAPRATGEVASVGDIIGAAATSEILETNAWDQEGRVRMGIMREITSRFPPDYFAADVLAEMQNTGFTHTSSRPNLEAWVFEALAKKQAEDPAAWGDITVNSVEALNAEVKRLRRAEYEDAQATLAMGGAGSGIAEVLTRMAVAMTDETSLAMMPLGGGGSIGRVILKESALGGLGEAAILPRMNEQAEKLNIPDPNPTTQIAMGMVFGAALPAAGRAISKSASLTVRGIDRYLNYRAGRNQAAPDTGAAGEALARDTEAALAAGEPIPPSTGIGGYADGSQNNIAFVQAMMPAAIRASERTGVDPRIIIAQAIQETGWGRHAPNNNYFGIKSHGQEGGSTLATNEVINGETVQVNASFRGYEDMAASVEGYADFLLANPRYREMMAAEGLDAQIAALGRSGYATDPNYASSIAALAGRITIDGVQLPANVRFSPAPAGGGADIPTGTRAGYTAPDQVVTPSGTRIDVAYEVVDASLLTRASGELQPRDRTRAASDAQITQIAAQLDPARLMPSAEADRGAPIIGPDNVIESGNGRVAAIQQAAPDRKAAYRAAITEAGFDIPEGIKEPVLVARRTSQLDQAGRVAFVNDANTSSIARMSATEQAAQDARALSSHTMAQYEPGKAISAPENTTFARAFLEGMPANERAALTTAEGRLNLDGERRLKQALFARAYGAPDLIAKHTEASDPAMRSLIDALAEAAPQWSALRADIEAGLIKPEMDLTDNLLDAVRLIGDARKTAAKGKTDTAGAIDDALAQISLEGQVHPLTEALVQIFRKGDRVRPDREITELLSSYTHEARIVGKTDAALFDTELSSGPMEVLDAIQKETDLFAPGGAGTRPLDEGLYRQPNRPGLESRSREARKPLDTSQADEAGYIDGAQSEGSIAAVRQGIADLQEAVKADGDFELVAPDGSKVRASELLDDIEADSNLAEIINICNPKGGA